MGGVLMLLLHLLTCEDFLFPVHTTHVKKRLNHTSRDCKPSHFTPLPQTYKLLNKLAVLGSSGLFN